MIVRDGYDYILRMERLGYLLYLIKENEYYFSNNTNISDIYCEGNYYSLSRKHANKTLINNFFKDYKGRFIKTTSNEDFISFPTTIFLEVTRRCNLECSHCFNSCGLDDNDDLCFYTIDKLITELHHMGITTIKITGGEPFMRKDIFEIFDILENMNIKFIVFTNGSFINSIYVKKLKSYSHLLCIRVSIDGNEETNDKIRGLGSFSRAIDALKLLEINKIPCEINYTITKVNYNQLCEVGNYLTMNSLNCLINIGAVKIAGRAKNKDTYKYYFDKGETDIFIKNVKVQISQSDRIKSFYMLEPLYYKLYGQDYGCPGARLTATVKNNGDVFPCGLLADYEEFICGNVNRNSFKEVWGGIRMQNFRSLPESSSCIWCSFYKNGCTGACRANALNYFGDICEEDINCAFYTTDFNELRYSK